MARRLLLKEAAPLAAHSGAATTIPSPGREAQPGLPARLFCAMSCDFCHRRRVGRWCLVVQVIEQAHVTDVTNVADDLRLGNAEDT